MGLPVLVYRVGVWVKVRGIGIDVPRKFGHTSVLPVIIGTMGRGLFTLVGRYKGSVFARIIEEVFILFVLNRVVARY